MTKGQRILIVVGSLLLAWILNTSLCEWEVNERRSDSRLEVLGYLKSEPGQRTLRDGTTVTYTRSRFTGLKVEMEIVWEFRNPYRVGEDDSKVASLFSLKRVSAKQTGWLGRENP